MGRIGRNVLWNWAGLALAMAIAFLMSPFLIRTLGDAQYGVWILMLSITGYMGLMDAGLKVSVVRFVAGHSATADSPALNETVSTALGLYVALAIIILAVAGLLSLVLDQTFELPEKTKSDARLVLIIAGATLAVTLVSSVFGGVLAGLQRYDISNAIGVCVSILGAFAIYAVVSQGHGIVGLATVHLFTQTILGILVWHASMRLRPGLRVGWRQVRLARVKQLYGYSAFVLLNSIAMLLLFRSGDLVTGFMLGAAAVTYFAIGGMLVEYLGKIVGSMTQVLHPLASSQYATGNADGLRSATLLSTRACLALALPASAGFIIVGPAFIAAWIGPEYAVTSGPILVVLTVGRLFWLAQSGAGNILLGSGKHKQLALLNVATGLAGIGLGVILARHFGLLGIAAGLSVAIVLIQGLVMPMLVCRAMSISPAEYLVRAVAGPVVATLPFATALFLLMYFLRPSSIAGIAVIVGVAGAFFLPAAYYACLDHAHKQQLAKRFALSRRPR